MLAFPDDTMDGVNARITLMRLSADKPDQAEAVMRYVRRLEDLYTRLEALAGCLVGVATGMIVVFLGRL